jgi:xanthine dehydrogenase accessory factor
MSVPWAPVAPRPGRRDRLLAAGAPQERIDLIHGTAGLDLGGGSPAEIALAICAEVLATRTNRQPVQLRTTTGPIHR